MRQEVVAASTWNLKLKFLAAFHLRSKTNISLHVLFPPAGGVLFKEKTRVFPLVVQIA